MRILVLLAVAIAVSACTSMLLGNTTSREPAGGSSTTSTPADSAISGEIRRRISDDPRFDGYAIGIRTVSGTVTLSGTVDSYTSRDRAVEIARSTGGVRQVDNRIVVNTNL